MRASVLAMTVFCVLTLAAGANAGQKQKHIYWLTFNEVGVGGQHRRVLSSHDVFPEVSSYSPRRRQLAYVPYFYDGARSNKLWRADVDHPGERLLFEAPGWITDVAWSPNGRTIAFTVGRGAPEAEAGIWLVDADGAHPRRLSDGGADLAWSPDSKSLALGRFDSAAAESIWVLSVDSLDDRYIGPGFRPRWSPNGRRLLFEFATGRTEPLKIQVIPARGGQARTIARGDFPSWSPNGSRIAFHRYQGTTRSLWTVSSHGGRARLLAEGAAGSAWSPGSRWIAFQQGIHYCGSALEIARVDRGQPRRLVTATRLLTPLAWSGNGRKVLYTGERCSNQ
jgi:Tol biopolymer transport system component